MSMWLSISSSFAPSPLTLTSPFVHRLLQRLFLKDDVIQRGAVQGDGCVGILRLRVGGMVQHAVFQLQLVFAAILTEIDVKDRFSRYRPAPR